MIRRSVLAPRCARLATPASTCVLPTPAWLTPAVSRLQARASRVLLFAKAKVILVVPEKSPWRTAHRLGPAGSPREAPPCTQLADWTHFPTTTPVSTAGLALSEAARSVSVRR